MARLFNDPIPTPPPIITLLTDFGASDVFVGSMKGVILGINPLAHIVDLTHDIPAHNVRAAAYLLHSAARYFPPGTIHVAVVDPGVGSERRPLLVFTMEQYFIAPDNGLLSGILAAEMEAEIRELTNKQYFLGPIGSTFHGRDAFAPAAAWLSRGEPIETFGPEAKNVIRFEIARPRQENDKLFGEVQHIDRFGNLITNISREDLVSFGGADQVSRVRVRIIETLIHGVLRFYADAPSGTLAALINSDGWLELFCHQARATDLVGAKIGDPVEVHLP
jgi:S-adenosyl-L-methionine hydrolase (adenosine-forming)